LLQRQTSGHQARTSSPFSVHGNVQTRKPSHPQVGGLPISGTFSGASSASQQRSNSAFMSGGRMSPMNHFANSSSLSQKLVQSPLGSRQPSPSSHEDQPVTRPPDKAQFQNPTPSLSARDDNPHVSSVSAFVSKQEIPHSAYESDVLVKREQAMIATGRY